MSVYIVKVTRHLGIKTWNIQKTKSLKWKQTVNTEHGLVACLWICKVLYRKIAL